MRELTIKFIKWLSDRIGFKVIILREIDGSLFFEGDMYLMAYIDIHGYFNNEEPFSSYTTKDKITKKTHLKILEKEINILEKEYYKPDSEGTGHYNTAISVLKERINDINKK